MSAEVDEVVGPKGKHDPERSESLTMHESFCDIPPVEFEALQALGRPHYGRPSGLLRGRKATRLR